MHTASLTTTVADVSPHRNFERGQVGIEYLMDALTLLLSTARSALFRSKCDHHTICAHVAFSSSTRMLMDDWDLMLPELFLFHRKENRG